MNEELEMLQMRKDQNLAVINEKTAENLWIDNRIREILEEEIIGDNPYWGPRDDLWGRECKLMTEIRVFCANSDDRALKMYAEYKKELNTLYVVPLVDDLEDVPAEIMTWYQREQTEHFFPIGWGGGLKRTGYFIDEINLDEGGEMPGYCMIWAGNAGSIGARDRFIAWWTQDDIMDIVASDAQRECDNLDWGYYRAQMTGTLPQWLADHPYYIPAE